MEEKTYTIKLADDTELSDLTLNGNNYISQEEVDESIFEDNCSPLTITDSEGNEQIFENAELIRVAQFDDGYYIAFREKSAEEIAMETIKSQIEYLAMMTEVEIEV